jgi:hypothetical protein
MIAVQNDLIMTFYDVTYFDPDNPPPQKPEEI